MDSSHKLANNANIDILYLKKMIFIFNALEKGWSVCKKDECYIFNKKHENQKEIFLDNYLSKFIKSNSEIDMSIFERK